MDRNDMRAVALRSHQLRSVHRRPSFIISGSSTATCDWTF